MTLNRWDLCAVIEVSKLSTVPFSNQNSVPSTAIALLSPPFNRRSDILFFITSYDFLSVACYSLSDRISIFEYQDREDRV